MGESGCLVLPSHLVTIQSFTKASIIMSEFVPHTVKAKFYIQKIEQVPHMEGGTVHLAPVCRGEANKTWSKWTPAGSLQMSILNPGAFEFFDSIVKDTQAKKRRFPEVFLTIESAPDED